MSFLSLGIISLAGTRAGEALPLPEAGSQCEDGAVTGG